MKSILFFSFLFTILMLGCHEGGHHQHAETGGHGHHGKANQHMHQSSFEDLVSRFEDPSRAEWQKPDQVVAQLGEIQGKTIMDLGAGTGYFSFPFAAKGAQVIVTDVDERFLDYVLQKRDSLGIADSLIQIRKVPYDHPMATEAELDWFFCSNTYHHIENRIDYMKKVKAGLKPGGKVCLVDFKKQESPHGPPPNIRLAAISVKKELTAAGFQHINILDSLLEEQYLVIAH